MIVIKRFNFAVGKIIVFLCLVSFPQFIHFCSMFYYRSISENLFSTNFKRILFGIYFIWGLYFSFYNTFVPISGNFTIEIFDGKGFNNQEKYAAAWIAYFIFVCKLSYNTIMHPDAFFMLNASLRRQS